LVNSNARLRRAPDYPWGVPSNVEERLRASPFYPGSATEPVFAGAFFGPNAGDERLLAWWRRYARMCASPGAWAAMQQMLFEVDVRHVLSTVRVPTLVIHRRDDAWTRVGHGRFLAENIPGAKYIELDGSEHQYFLGDTTRLLNEIAQFVTGRFPTPDVDRVLTTVMFTDVVGSTDQASNMGDRQWLELLATHDGVTRAELERFRGREIETTGDGFLAVFDGPGRAVRCACAISDAVRAIGIELRGDDIGGIAVHIAQRVQALAQPNEVLVSRTVADLVGGSGIEFQDRGDHELKGVRGSWRLFGVRG
jgi:class 3 adenylate cyclase